MLEKWRRSQVKRLLALTERFENIRDRANELNDLHRQYKRMSGDQNSPDLEFGRMALRANQNSMACVDANNALLVDRASPLLFWWQLPPLEKIANSYEKSLEEAEAGAEYGRKAFRERMGLSLEKD